MKNLFLTFAIAIAVLPWVKVLAEYKRKPVTNPTQLAPCTADPKYLRNANKPDPEIVAPTLSLQNSAAEASTANQIAARKMAACR